MTVCVYSSTIYHISFNMLTFVMVGWPMTHLVFPFLTLLEIYAYDALN